ncbi:outer membrane beta-barrel protein [Vibrio rumoiensis]|uniref:outer membrane beta-barrel protein n=1 Tax=Vibrio rumoiensis TaxID=76258 RepID=UPI000B5C5CCB|nr:outer membrane beta-barrel protein [Vibrio rumoiensis]
MKIKTLACAFIISTIAAAPALADANKGFYIGGGVGAAAFASPDLEDDVDDGDIDGVDDINFDSSGLAYNLYAGYQFNRVVALELSYNNYADTKISARSSISKSSSSIPVGKFSTDGMSLSANLGYTFDNGLRPFALAGLGYIDAPNDDGVASFHGGLGLDYTPTALQSLTFRAAYQFDAYEIDADDDYVAISGMITAGVAYRF